MQKKDGVFHPVAYFSKRTSSPESNYHSFELETLAIILALRHWKVYLKGIRFTVITDCKSVKLTLLKKQVNPRIARWVIEMQAAFNFGIDHRAGTALSHVDALSRCSPIAVNKKLGRHTVT